MSASDSDSKFNILSTNQAIQPQQQPQTFYAVSSADHYGRGQTQPHESPRSRQRRIMQASGLPYDAAPRPFQGVTEGRYWIDLATKRTLLGQVVTAPRVVLYNNHPELRPVISAELDWLRTNNLLLPSPLHTLGQNQPQDRAPTQSVGLQQPHLTNGNLAQGTSGHSGRRIKAEEDDLAPVAINIDAYTSDPDLDTAEKCRRYLSDPGSSIKLAIQGDDWQEVKASRFQEYVGRVYNSLTAPYARELPGVKMDDAKMAKYHQQQRKATLKIANLLETPTQIKAASARCLLLVDAAVSFHEGIPEDLYNRYQSYVAKDRQPDRTCRLDVKSILSVRLAKISTIISNNKLIAREVLEGKNIDAMVRDPYFHGQAKLTYLSSNLTRQARTDEERSKKRARLEAEQEEEEAEDSDEENLGCEVVVEATSKRIKRSLSED